MKRNHSRWARAGRRSVWAIAALAAVCAALTVAPGAGAAGKAAAFTPAPPQQPIDAQNWKWQDDMTWNDYHPIPGPDYSDPSIPASVRTFHAALVVTDFPDKTFTLSQPQGSTIFGQPGAAGHDIPRADVPKFLADYLNTPSTLNHFQTLNRYWMEDTYGKYAVQLTVFGPYQLPGKSWQYFAQDFGGSTGCPNKATAPCNKDFRTDAKAAWVAATGNANIQSGFDNTFYVSAGEDESSTWQEFGNMLWTQNTVPEAFGPHAYDTTLPNWMQTRYVPWTSWAAGETIWPNATTSGVLSSIEGESSGMGTYAHEFTHNLGILDNYNNPYGSPVQRSASGYWDMMSRGSFGGPGGPHSRYGIPSVAGGTLGSQHDLRNKVKLGFLSNSQILRLNRSGLATTGMVVAKIKAREVAPAAGELEGVTLNLDGATPVDEDPTCTNTVANPNPLCANPVFTGYTMEVVQQLGSDSFDPGHGVLIAKTKTNESSSCGQFACYVWYIDAHPADINRVDFVDGQGVTQKVTIGDERQLDDATFNAGTNSGSSYEYEDTPNRLHFYILDKSTDAQGVMSYTVGIKSLDGAGPQTRGVSVANAPDTNNLVGSYTTCTFPLTNTGAAAATSTTAHPQGDVSQWVNNDIYRLSASAIGAGWHADLSNALATAQFGQTVSVPVYVTRDAGSAPGASVSLTATSESDSSKTSTASCNVTLDKPVVGYTLSPAAPNGSNGWYTSAVGVTWQVSNADSTTGCDPTTVTTEGTNNITCSATNDGGTTSVTATVKLDLNNPTSSASISPPAQNGWFASPTVTLTGQDGAGSGIDHISYKVDGEANWHTYTGPLSGFSTGNHFVQFQATDVAGRVESTVNLVAFKADAVKPSVTVTAPADGAVYPLGKVVTAKFKCTDAQSGLASCTGTVANGANLSTSTIGSHTFTVTGTDKAGNTTTVTHHYTVVYTWNGFFSPISNDSASKLNLVHAGDLIKIGFGLNGNRGLGVLASATSVAVSCPSWAPHTVPAGGAGTTSGLSYGVSSGHYTYGWATDAAWAGTCRQFQLTLNDGTPAHTATFRFFS